MKKTLFIIFLFFPTVIFAQKVNYLIQGTLSKLNIAVKIYLICQTATDKVVDSVVLNKGKFSFSGSLNNPGIATLVVDHERAGSKRFLEPNGLVNTDMLPLYLEGETITINGSDLIHTANTQGSSVSVDYQHLLANLEMIQQRIAKLVERANRSTPQEQNKLQMQYDSIRVDQKIIFIDFIKEHTNSMISLDALKALGGSSPDANEIEPLFSMLAPSIQNSASGQLYGALLRQLKVTALGSIAPDFSQKDVDGKSISLSSFRGKYVLVDFWASWCGPCRQENPNVVRAFNRFKDKNFTILGVSLDKSKSSWLHAIKNDQLNWTQVSDLKGWLNEVAQRYNITSIPQNFLLDPQGRIIGKNLREEALINKLEEVLANASK